MSHLIRSFNSNSIYIPLKSNLSEISDRGLIGCKEQ
nr:MAG TPA: hypothetical protein [Caudoviricetes sp.]